MGLLVVFWLGSGALVFERVTGATKGTFLGTIWELGQIFVFAAVCLLLGGAVFFYRQRATLLVTHGRICLSIARGESIEEHLSTIDKWMFWWEYRVAWGFVWLAALAVVGALASRSVTILQAPVVACWIIAGTLLGGLLVYIPWLCVLYRRDREPAEGRGSRDPWWRSRFRT